MLNSNPGHSAHSRRRSREVLCHYIARKKLHESTPESKCKNLLYSGLTIQRTGSSCRLRPGSNRLCLYSYTAECRNRTHLRVFRLLFVSLTLSLTRLASFSQENLTFSQLFFRQSVVIVQLHSNCSRNFHWEPRLTLFKQMF